MQYIPIQETDEGRGERMIRSNEALANTRDGVVFRICSQREEKFLRDLIRHANQDFSGCNMPETAALFSAIESAWGGAEKTTIQRVSPQLVYYLAVFADMVMSPSVNVEEEYEDMAHDVLHILQGFMETIAWAIEYEEERCIKKKDGGMYIDLFRIPQWFYDEVKERQKITIGY